MIKDNIKYLYDFTKTWISLTLIGIVFLTHRTVKSEEAIKYEKEKHPPRE